MNHQIKHRKTLTTFWHNALVIGAAVLIAAVVISLFGCQKESSFTSKGTPVIESDHHLKPAEGWNYNNRPESFDLWEAARKGGNGKGKGGGKPPKDTTYQPPTDTTGNDEPDEPPTPSTGNVLYLDFDGEYVANSYWNVNGDLNLRYSGMMAAEIDTVVTRFRKEYEALGFTVTTDRAVFDGAPQGHRQQVIFTESWEWYGQAGGVAYIGSYKWTDAQPCFVFTSLLSYSGKYCADAGIHEAGHTLSLRHPYDGYVTYGQWMGVAYYVPWGFFESYVRESTGNYVDQFAIIKSNL